LVREALSDRKTPAKLDVEYFDRDGDEASSEGMRPSGRWRIYRIQLRQRTYIRRCLRTYRNAEALHFDQGPVPTYHAQVFIERLPASGGHKMTMEA
jgi:hypothetical protein